MTASFPFQEVLSGSTVDEETDMLSPWYEITGLARHVKDAFSPSTWEMEPRESEFKANLVYTACSKP